MKPKDKLMLRFELTNLQARFALLAEMHKEAMTVLPEMRRVLQEQRAEITTLTEENARLKEILATAVPVPEPERFKALEQLSRHPVVWVK